jgi:type 1 glutamine amidotransferase
MADESNRRKRRVAATRDPTDRLGQASEAMRVATVLILSVGPLVGFGCTGAEPREDDSATAGSSGIAGAGVSGAGGPAGGGAGSANAGRSNGGAPDGGATSGGVAGSAGSAGSASGGNANEAGSGGTTNGGAAASGNGGTGGAAPLPNVLVFSRTVEFRHDSIPDGVSALRTLATERGWQLTATEDPSVFGDAGLASFDVVVFLCTTGDVLDTNQEGALERFVRAGGGWVGIHSASDTEYGWPFYGGLVGAYFRAHPPGVQEALVRVETAAHPATSSLPETFRRTDEWYAFAQNPRPNVTVLLTLDESTYAPGTATMGSDHPIAWFHTHEGGRAFYTALGHTRESYSEPHFLAHVAGGIEWAAGG